MENIGQIFQQAREARGFSLSEAAARTRIKIQHIEAMERNDFSGIAAPAYARGFIRIYAETLGLDPAPLLAAYARMQAPEREPPEVATRPLPPLPRGRALPVALASFLERVKEQWARYKPRITPRRIWAGAAVLTGLLLAIVLIRQCSMARQRRAVREPPPPVPMQTVPDDLLWPVPEPYVDEHPDLFRGSPP